METETLQAPAPPESIAGPSDSATLAAQAIEKPEVGQIDAPQCDAKRNPKSKQEENGTDKPVERQMFVAWLSLPTYERKPKTQKDLAKALGVTEWTLSRWKHSGALEEAMALAEVALRERHGEILKALGDKAAAGDVQAIRTYLETICQRGAAARIQVNSSGPTQINIAELVRETAKVDALPAWLESEGQ